MFLADECGSLIFFFVLDIEKTCGTQGSFKDSRLSCMSKSARGNHNIGKVYLHKCNFFHF
jgi:hypothetical protein